VTPRQACEAYEASSARHTLCIMCCISSKLQMHNSRWECTHSHSGPCCRHQPPMHACQSFMTAWMCLSIIYFCIWSVPVLAQLQLRRSLESNLLIQYPGQSCKQFVAITVHTSCQKGCCSCCCCIEEVLLEEAAQLTRRSATASPGKLGLGELPRERYFRLWYCCTEASDT
jgi:hypothetical protein